MTSKLIPQWVLTFYTSPKQIFGYAPEYPRISTTGGGLPFQTLNPTLSGLSWPLGSAIVDSACEDIWKCMLTGIRYAFLQIIAGVCHMFSWTPRRTRQSATCSLLETGRPKHENFSCWFMAPELPVLANGRASTSSHVVIHRSAFRLLRISVFL